MKPNQPVRFTCIYCGTDNLEFKADVCWLERSQRWHVTYVNENECICHECGHSLAISRPVTDMKSLANIAIKREEGS